jgi:hypothetical protein
MELFHPFLPFSVRQTRSVRLEEPPLPEGALERTPSTSSLSQRMQWALLRSATCAQRKPWRLWGAKGAVGSLLLEFLGGFKKPWIFDDFWLSGSGSGSEYG